VTEPRDLTDLVPAEVRTELAAAVAALELHGPAVTNALRRLDQATTAAWNAVHPADPTQDEWRLVERAVGIDRGWNAAYPPSGSGPLTDAFDTSTIIIVLVLGAGTLVFALFFSFAVDASSPRTRPPTSWRVREPRESSSAAYVASLEASERAVQLS
jgi:hypothetical protein